MHPTMQGEIRHPESTSHRVSVLHPGPHAPFGAADHSMSHRQKDWWLSEEFMDDEPFDATADFSRGCAFGGSVVHACDGAGGRMSFGSRRLHVPPALAVGRRSD